MAEKEKIPIMINGLNPNPKSGKMSRMIAERALASGKFSLVPFSLSGPEVVEDYLDLPNSGPVRLVKSEARETIMPMIKNHHGNFISIEATVPDAVEENADFYCRHKLPFVMLTTGGDRKALEERIRNSEIVALPSTNMAPPIASVMDYADEYSKANEGLLNGCMFGVSESHQSGKKDASGTARTMLKPFRRLGIQMDDELVKELNEFKMPKLDKSVGVISLPLGYGSSFTMIRDPKTQLRFGVPEDHLGGHGYHRYELKPTDAQSSRALLKFGEDFSNFFIDNPALKGYSISGGTYLGYTATSPDRNVRLELTFREQGGLVIRHDINGRNVYVDGTLDFAVPHVWKNFKAGEKGKVYSMMDALKKN